MENERLLELEKSIKELSEKIKPAKKSWVEYIAPLSTFFSTVILGAVGLYITSRIQNQQLDAQTKIQKVQVLKDFLPYIGDSNPNKNKAALIAISSLGFDSLAIDLALGINNQASQEVLQDRIKTSTGDRKSLYQNALNKLKADGGTSKLSAYPKGLRNAAKELADSAREIPPGSNSGPFVAKYSRGLQNIPWTGFFVSWCFLNDLPPAEYPFSYTGGVMQMLNDVKQKGYWFSNADPNKKPQPGDIYFITRTNNTGQCGIVYTAEGDMISSIEANVAEENNVDSKSADRVALRTRTIDQINGGFARVPEK